MLHCLKVIGRRTLPRSHTCTAHTRIITMLLVSMVFVAIDNKALPPLGDYKSPLRPPQSLMLPPAYPNISTSITMAWLDRYQNDSLFYDPLDDDSQDVSQLLVLVFRAYLSPLIFIHGIWGNILSLVVLSRLYRRSPGRFNLYAIAITTSFLLILIFDTLLDDFFGRGLGWLTHYRFNLKMDQISSLSCKFITYVTDSCGFVATSTLVIFGIDRVRTVYSPLQFRGDRHLRFTAILIVAVVVITLVLFSPTFLFYDVVVSSETNKTSCTLANPSLPGATYILLIYVLGSYTLPTIVIIICNLLIAYQLMNIKRKQQKSGVDVSSRRDIRRIIGHLAINTSFLLLMIPLVVVILMRYASSLQPNHHTSAYRKRLIHLSRFFSSLLSVYFSSSFWVFFLFLPSFRDAVLEMLLACPLIASSSLCAPRLYKYMSHGGARRFRAKSMTASLLYISPLQATEREGFHLRTSLPPAELALLSRPVRSRSTPNIVRVNKP